MKFLLFILSFVILYLAGGRKIAIPYSIAITNNLFITIILTFAVEFIQIPFFYFIYSKGAEKMKTLMKIKVKSKKEIKESKAIKWAKNFGKAGVFILSILPSFGGGVLTAVLLAFVLKIDKKISYLIILVGSLVGIVLLTILSHGIIQSIINLIR